jgi:hypothetical protein
MTRPSGSCSSGGRVLATAGATPAEGDLDGVDLEAVPMLCCQGRELGGDVQDLAAAGADQMVVRGRDVRVVTNGAAVRGHLSQFAEFDQLAQGRLHRRSPDFGQSVAGRSEHLLGREMQVVARERLGDDSALRGQPPAPFTQPQEQVAHRTPFRCWSVLGSVCAEVSVAVSLTVPYRCLCTGLTPGAIAEPPRSGSNGAFTSRVVRVLGDRWSAALVERSAVPFVGDSSIVLIAHGRPRTVPEGPRRSCTRVVRLRGWRRPGDTRHAPTRQRSTGHRRQLVAA